MTFLNDTNITDEECYVYIDTIPDPSTNLYAKVIFGAIYTLIFTLGVFGNAMIICITWLNTNLQTVQNLFILNLAAADLVVCFICLPVTPVTNIYKNWYFGSGLCHVLPMVQGASIFVCTFTLTAIAMDRYVLIMHPYRKPLKTKGALIIIVCIWVISVLWTLPYGYFMTIKTYPGLCGEFCDEQWPELPEGQLSLSKLFSYSVLVFQFLVPLSIISFSYGRIMQRLNARARKRLQRLREQRAATVSSAGYPVRSGFSRSTVHNDAVSNSLTKSDQPLTTVDTKLLPSVLNGELSTQITGNTDYTGNSDYTGITGRTDNTGTTGNTDYTDTTGTTDYTATSGNTDYASAIILQNYEKRAEILRSRRRTTRILICMVLIFGVCWTPHSVVTIMSDYINMTYNDVTYNYLVNNFTHSFAMLTILANPVLYAWLNEVFRKALRTTVRTLSKARTTRTPNAYQSSDVTLMRQRGVSTPNNIAFNTHETHPLVPMSKLEMLTSTTQQNETVPLVMVKQKSFTAANGIERRLT